MTIKSKISFLFLLVLTFASFYRTNVYAQDSRPAALVLTNNFQQQFLSSYLKKHENKISTNNVTPLLRTHQLEAISHFNNSGTRGSIIPLGYKGQELWVSFETINKSNQENWFIDFGHYFNGRFGLLKNIDIFITNFDGDILYKKTISNKQKNTFVPIALPTNKRSIVALGITGQAGIPTTVPLKIVSSSAKDIIIEKRKSLQTYILFGLIGMVFFFLSMCVSQSSPAYPFFSAYYMILCLSVILEAQLFFFIPFLSGMVIPTLMSLLAISSLIIIKSLWEEVDNNESLDILFKSFFILLIALPITALFLPTNLALIKVILYFFPSLLVLALIPILLLIQTQYGKEDTMPFVFSWFILLCGLAISTTAISGLMPPLSTTLNAFWYALVPQALFLIYALKIKTRGEETHISHAKTLEIVENESVSKFRQSKELAEQERLLKVIEQERRVLGELRKSEARKAEEMAIEKERADEANRAKSAFLAVVSHEIRTPMSGIMGMVKMLIDSGLNKQQKEYAQTIQESSNAMLSLLNDILDFEKVERGKMDIENIGFNLPRLMRGVATLMNGHAAQKGIKLVTSIDETLPKYVKGDPTRLRQILLNLTGNAIKFTNEGSVTITAKLIKEGKGTSPNEIYFGITDSGIGMSKEGQQKIFDAFSQADKSVSRKFGGTGLGLAISKGLVEAMGSNININSNEGEGSTFFFTLKMENAQTEEDSSSSNAPEIYEHHKKPMHILIVDDNDINLKVITGFLEKAPHKLDTAKTAEDAITKLEINKYDLILMDIELPGINGDEATRRIRKNNNDKISQIPVIALTGNVLKEDTDRYLDAGMNGILTKPVKPELLNKTIDKVITQTIKTNTAFNSNNTINTKEEKPEIINATEQGEKQIPSPTHNSVLKTPPPKKSISVARTSRKMKPSLNIKNTPISTENAAKKDTSKTIFDNDILDTLKGHLETEQLKEMLEEVFTKSEEIIKTLKIAIDNNSPEETSARAHELKGMAGNFGLMQISDLASQIENIAKSGSIDGVNELVSQMPTALTNARAAADEWLKS